MSETKASPRGHRQDWKEPTQARSKARVAAILDAARDLAVEAGSVDIAMSDVAKHAGVPIGSVYQYFPTKSVLLTRLFAREMEPIDLSIRAGLQNTKSLEDVFTGIEGLIRSQIELVRQRPGLLVIWSSPTLHPDIQRADLENSKRNAEEITQKIISVRGSSVRRQALWSSILLMCHLWGSIIRLSVMLDEEDNRDAVVDQYIEMMIAHLRNILKEG